MALRLSGRSGEGPLCQTDKTHSGKSEPKGIFEEEITDKFVLIEIDLFFDFFETFQVGDFLDEPFFIKEEVRI